MPPSKSEQTVVRQGSLLGHASCIAVSLVLGSSPVCAQDEPPVVQGPAPSQAGGGTEVFEPAFFAVFNPISANDMVRQVPGFSIDNGDNRRGFGATAGNVLINGERPSSKNGISAELDRIPAANVARIELIRGGSSDVDIRGRTTLVNVVLRDASASDPVTTYSAQIHTTQGRRLSGTGSLARAFRFAGADVNLSAESFWTPRRNLSEEVVYVPGGDVIATRDEYQQTNYRELVLSGTARWRPNARDAFGLNAQFAPYLFGLREVTNVFDAAGDPLRIDALDHEETDAWSSEFGADWERRLTGRLSVKLVGLDRHSEWQEGQEFSSTPVGGGAETTFIDRATMSGERIGRGALTWRANDAHTLEAGIEGAFNFRETDLDIAVDDGGGPVPIDLVVSDTRVEELRGEAFVTDVWEVSPRLSLETGFTFEASRITQTGDAEQEREFTYPKPRLIATYALSDADQLRFSLIRDVAQLDFSEFASAIDVDDDLVTVGNPNLEPERTWRARAEWERRYGRGAFTFSVTYDQVEDVQDLVVLDDFTGPGNLGDGGRLSWSLQSSTPMDRFGLSNAVLRFNANQQRTWVDDPLTGLERAFANENTWGYYFEFRQDLPEHQMAWGWDYASGSEYSAFRVSELQVRDGGEGDLDFFVETTRWGDVTLRLGVDNIFNQVRTLERFIYDGTRADGDLDRIDLRDQQSGQFVYLRMSGSF